MVYDCLQLKYLSPSHFHFLHHLWPLHPSQSTSSTSSPHFTCMIVAFGDCEVRKNNKGNFVKKSQIRLFLRISMNFSALFFKNATKRYACVAHGESSLEMTTSSCSEADFLIHLTFFFHGCTFFPRAVETE